MVQHVSQGERDAGSWSGPGAVKRDVREEATRAAHLLSAAEMRGLWTRGCGAACAQQAAGGRVVQRV